ncbi:hypothetical protein A6R68_20110, partial [Neotoma lepida]
PSKKSLHGRRKRYVLNVSNTVYNIEQKTDHFLKCQHEQRQEINQEYSHQFLALVVMSNIDVDKIKKQAEKLSNLQAINSCRQKAVVEEARKQMDILERKLTIE